MTRFGVATKPKRMDMVTVYLTPRQCTELSTLSDVSRVPVSVFVREGIDLLIKRVTGGQSRKKRST